MYLSDFRIENVHVENRPEIGVRGSKSKHDPKISEAIHGWPHSPKVVQWAAIGNPEAILVEFHNRFYTTIGGSALTLQNEPHLDIKSLAP